MKPFISYRQLTDDWEILQFFAHPTNSTARQTFLLQTSIFPIRHVVNPIILFTGSASSKGYYQLQRETRSRTRKACWRFWTQGTKMYPKFAVARWYSVSDDKETPIIQLERPSSGRFSTAVRPMARIVVKGRKKPCIGSSVLGAHGFTNYQRPCWQTWHVPILPARASTIDTSNFTTRRTRRRRERRR